MLHIIPTIQIRPGQAQRAYTRFFPVLGSIRAWLVALLFCLLVLSGCGSVGTQTQGKPAHTQNAATTLNYVAIGASDTFGTGAGDPYTESWPVDLSNLLGSQTHLINLGVPSMTVHAALTAELPIALDSHPNLVTIWLAVNDLATNVPVDNYSRDLDTLLSRLQAAAPHTRIAVGNVPNLTSVPFFQNFDQSALSQSITSYNTAIASVVQRQHAILVDLSAQGYNLQTFPEYISNDGLHPSSIGYLRLAQLFYSALQTG